jgi:hypothetical protein
LPMILARCVSWAGNPSRRGLTAQVIGGRITANRSCEERL